MLSASGALERDEVCDTCSLSQLHCPGHIGHIPLPLPAFNPVYFRDLHKLLRGSCFSCHRLLAPPAACQTILAQLQVSLEIMEVLFLKCFFFLNSQDTKEVNLEAKKIMCLLTSYNEIVESWRSNLQKI